MKKEFENKEEKNTEIIAEAKKVDPVVNQILEKVNAEYEVKKEPVDEVKVDIEEIEKAYPEPHIFLKEVDSEEIIAISLHSLTKGWPATIINSGTYDLCRLPELLHRAKTCEDYLLMSNIWAIVNRMKTKED